MLRDMLSKALVVVALLVGTASAGPTTRFGLTYAAHDPAASSVEVGPMIAFGQRIGGLVGEVEWAYLSFLDPHASPTGVQRLGLTLRADLLAQRGYTCFHRFACSHGRSIYGEIGAAERFGKWYDDAYRQSPQSSPQPELHIGLGLELDNQLVPYHNGWQLGIRFAVAPADQTTMAVCRGTCPGAPASSGGGLEKAVFVEWMFLLGR